MAQGNLSDALAAYEAALSVHQSLVDRRPDDIERQRDLSVSHDRIGDVLVAQGNLAPALESYRASLAIRERLAQADPGNAGWQRDLIVSHWKLADLAEKAGEEAEVRRHWQVALKIAKDMAASERLAPRDAWIVGQIEERLAALPDDTAGQ